MQKGNTFLLRDTTGIIPSGQDSSVSVSAQVITWECRECWAASNCFQVFSPNIPDFLPWISNTIFFLFFSEMKGFLIATASQEERWFDHIVTGFYAFIFLFTIVTNSFLFMVFLRNKSFRDLSTYLIVQMAAADVFYLCLTCSIIVIKNLEVQISRPVCKSLLYVEGVARFASSLSLMLISLERSMSVCSPTMCYTIRKISGVKKKVSLSLLHFAFFQILCHHLRKYFN